MHVLRKREDGYHDIETVLVRIGLHDTLRISPADSFLFTCSDSALPVNADNLCVKAVNMMARHFDIDPQIALHLDKRVPYGAGLGGGSSDAAHTLLMLNEYWALQAPQDLLHTFAAQLGSDVPFFLGGNAALGRGRGEILTPIMMGEGQEYSLPCHMLLAVPPVHVSTKEAYQYVKPNDDNRANLTDLVLSNDLERWKETLVNDFEASVFKSHPRIEEVKESLYHLGAQYAAMSGSGSSVFGLFTDQSLCKKAATTLQAKSISTWVDEIK